MNRGRWHAAVHGFAPILGFMALLAFHLVIARRFKSQGRSGWMAVSIVIGIGSFVLSAVPNFAADYETGTFNFLPLWFGSGLIYFYTSFVLAKLKGETIS